MFEENIKKLREEAGLTQEEFAEKIFVTRTAVSKWENGKSYPSVDSLKVISELFDVSIDTLISSDEFKEVPTFKREQNPSLKYYFSTLISDMKTILKNNWVQCTIVLLFSVPIFSLAFLKESIDYFGNLKDKPVLLVLLIYASIKIKSL